MLRMATNTSWTAKTNEVLYQELQPLSETRERRMGLAGHGIRHTTKMAYKLVLWGQLVGKEIEIDNQSPTSTA